MSYENPQTQERVSFFIYGSIQGRSEFVGEIAGKIAGRFIPSTANGFDNHRIIYPQLPEEVRDRTEDNHASYEYLIVVLNDGSEWYVGYPWINAASWTTLDGREIQVPIRNFQDPDYKRVTAILRSHNYDVGPITAVD